MAAFIIDPKQDSMTPGAGETLLGASLQGAFR